MILTLTLNPSMDAIYFTDTLLIGEVNRCNNPIKVVGGKGINASRTASILGSQVQALGVLAGENGKLIQAQLKNETFDTFFLPIRGESRNAVTIMDKENNQTEIVELGPEITSKTEQWMLEKILSLSTTLKEKPIIALCGSANTKNEQLYKNYLEKITFALGSTVKVLTDISGSQLKNVLAGTIKPYFIKPNIQEFSELLDIPVTTKQDIINQLFHPILENIPFVLISCGKSGAIAKVNQQLFDITIPQIEVVNPTGSGDATVGGVAYGLDQQFSIEDTLRYAMACGMSNAMEKKVGYISSTTVKELKDKIILKKI